MNDIELDKELEQQFLAINSDWEEWQNKAQSLRRAALVIRKEAQRDWDDWKLKHCTTTPDEYQLPPSLVGTMTFLNGLAIENLVKALLIKKNGSISKNDFTHKITDLFEKVNFELSGEEKDYIDRLRCFVEWAGRYPTPTNFTEFRPKELSCGIKVQQFYTDFICDESLIFELIRKLEIMLRLKDM